MAARLGPGAVAERRARLAAWRAALAPDAAVDLPPPTPDDPGPAHWTFAQRWQDATAARRALRALAAARRLDPAAVTDTGVPLGPGDAARVAGLEHVLATRLVVLVERARPEQAGALVLGLARLATLERSRHSGRWIVLDGFPADAAVFDAAAVAARRADLLPLAAEARRRFEHAHAALVAAPSDGGFPEADFAAFEAAAMRRTELAGAVADGRPLRVRGGPLLPDRAADVRLAPPPWPADRLQAALTAAAARERRYGAALQRQLDYDLVGHNCVTELLALARAAAPATRLDAPLAFIPFVATRAVARQWPITAATTLPSRRQATLAAQAPGPRRWLREGNVLTATAYRPSPDDSLFLFFTDDVVAARPLLGAANLVVALGGAALALPLAPFDGGARLGAALRGAFWSLPELAFWSVRKGSYPLLPPEPSNALQSGAESTEISACGGFAPTASCSSGPS
ncbi:MAG: hypothetical protein KIT14_04995 [bacterium]|nr:hypothetical protein [bacterium]